MGHQQEELEVVAHLQGYGLTAIVEKCWGGSHDWNVGTEGQRLFRKHRQGKRGGNVVLYDSDPLEHMELGWGRMRSQPKI